MPSAAGMSHQYLTSDVRYIDDHKLGGRAHAISIMDNHSRCILASALTRLQDLASYLSMLCAAVEEYDSPETLVTGRQENFQSQTGESRLRDPRHSKARDSAREVLAGLHRDDRQRRRAEASGARPGPSGRRCREKCRKDLYATSACWFRSTRLSTILDTPIHKTSIL
jgi:hypothetical protein